MKVIDLLNKIANGEINWYTNFYHNKMGYTTNFDLWNGFDIVTRLNDEIEITKEIKKIDLGVLNTQSEKNREFKRAINELIDIVKELKNEKENN